MAHITDLSIIGSKLGNNNDSIDFKVSLFNWWYKSDLFCIRCLKFIKNNDLKKKQEIDEKVNLYSNCIDCGFKKFETINKEELSDLLKVETTVYMKQCYSIVSVWKIQKVKTLNLQRQMKENQNFYRSAQCVIVKKEIYQKPKS